MDVEIELIRMYYQLNIPRAWLCFSTFSKCTKALSVLFKLESLEITSNYFKG